MRILPLASSLITHMWKALQSGLSAIAGTQEPEYGPDAIHPVADSFRATTSADLAFQLPAGTNVETMTFYFSTDTHAGFFQIIHSNVMDLTVTAQMTFKVFDLDEKTGKAGEESIWRSVKLEDFEIVNGHDFHAKNLTVTLQDDNSYLMKATCDNFAKVELKFSRVGDGIIFGQDGKTLYGDDVNEPWGSMRHVFWPRCTTDGHIEILKETANGVFEQERKIVIEGRGMYVMALQGMKPHHAAATWDFLNYQSDNYSAVVMEFTTPPSYATTKVSLGMVVDKDGKVIVASKNLKTKHLNERHDEESGWEVPQKITYDFDDSKVQIGGNLNNLIEKVDVMAELPGFVKSIASAASGTKPYIYQFGNWMELDVGGEEKEKGWAYSESTFISAI